MTSSQLTDRKVTWDYAASVERVRPMVVKWGTMTVDLLHELCQAHAALSRTGRPKSDANASVLKTWGRYCLDIGMEKSTVNRWLLRYDDETRTVKELPEPEPVQASTKREPDKPQEPVVDGGSNGNGRPKGKLDPERQARVDEFKERVMRDDATARKTDSEPMPKDEVDDLLRRADEQLSELREAAERFSHLTLSGRVDDAMQSGMLGLLRQYILGFDTAERRTEVAHNLIKAIRLIVHDVNGDA